MRNRLRIAMIILFAAAVTVPVAVGAAEWKAPLASMDLQDGDGVVFLGDSITHQCLYTQYVEDYFYTRMPHRRLRLHNAGVGGAQAWDALERFDRDVAAYKPKYVTVLLGMNDGHYQPFDQATFDRYHQDMTELIGRIQAAGAAPILMTPTMFDSRAARLRDRDHKQSPAKLELYNSVLAYYGTWLQEVALDSGYGWIDMFHPLNQLTLQQRKTQPEFTMIPDSVHPSPPGQVVMACSMVGDMRLPRQVSSIRIIVRKNGKARPVVKGGKLSDLTMMEDAMQFTWLADSLPWVLPEEARPGVKLARLGQRFGNELLSVYGLPAGKYRLTIDDTVVGSYWAAALARGIHLQSNTKTPQYGQALEVAQLNKKRNEGPVRALRNEWSIFQQYSRAAASLAKNPDSEELQKRVATVAKKLEGREQRIAKHEQDARQIEDQIFQQNQPKPRRYSLRRVNSARNSEPAP